MIEGEVMRMTVTFTAESPEELLSAARSFIEDLLQEGRELKPGSSFSMSTEGWTYGCETEEGEKT